MNESKNEDDLKADLDEAISLPASGENEAATKVGSASRWAEALQKLSKEDREQFDFAQKSIDDPKFVLSNVLAATKKRKEECMKKRWKLVIKGQTIIVRDILEKLGIWVQKFMAIGDTVIQYDPVHAALPWAAVRLIMQVSINDMEIFGHVLSSLENISNLIAQCQIIEIIYLVERRKKSDELYGQLSESITDLYATILGYLAEIMHYYGLNTAVRILKSVGVSKVDMKAKYEPVETAQTKFRRLAELAEAQDLGSAVDGIQGIEQHLKAKDAQDQTEMRSLKDAMKALHEPIDRIDNRLGEIQDGIEQQVRTQILKAISTIPYGAHHKTASKGRLEGSGRWLLNKLTYSDWRKRSYSSVLWLHGIPGSGKTKLASLVVDEIKGKEHMAYFYCLRNPAEPHRAQCDKILASFVRQLASLTPSDPILPPIIEHYEEAIEGFVGFEDQAWTSDECVEVLLQLVDEYPAVTFVLDALDEVDQEERQELLDALTRILKESNSLVRVFISSRSNYDIAFYLTGTPNIYIEADDNAEDISTFIDTQLTSAKLLHGKLTPSLREEITRTLQEGAKGMFRWVDLQIQSLKRVKVAADLRTRLGALPDTLEGSYWEIYQDIQQSGENAFQLANFTFQWLLYAHESISIEALAVLACTNSPSVSETAFSGDEVLDVCSNLIVTRQNSFDFAHLSVREFFERLHNRDIHNYQSEPGHAAIATACLRLLNLALIEERGAELHERYMKAIQDSSPDDDLDKQKGEGGQNTTERRDDDPENKGDEHTKESGQNNSTQASAGQDGEADPKGIARKITRWTSRMREKDIQELCLEIFALVSSDDVYGQPSDYAVTWAVDHIEKSDKRRLESPLADLIKTFVLEKNNELGGSTYKVSRGFRVWSALMTRFGGSSPRQMLESAAQLPPSPIWVACQMDWLEVVEYLYKCSYPGINAGREIRALKTSFEVNPMWYAVLSKKHNLVDCLTRCNADAARVFSVDTFNEPIVTAATENDTELITILSKQNYGGREVAEQAFVSAANEGHCESLSLLLDLSLVTIDRVGHNALCFACAGGHIDAVGLLLDKGAPTRRGAFMLYRAVLHQRMEVSRFLISRDIGLDGLSSALVTAISNSDKECVDFLLEQGAQKEGVALVRAIRDKTSMTALELIKAGYEVHGKYLEKRRTALHYAALSGQSKVAEALLEAFADVNCADADGRTPLHLAAANGHDDCVRLLMKHGADVMIEDVGGQIPLDLAEERDCITTEEIIREEMERLLVKLMAERDTT